MDNQDLIRHSKFLSLVLRHRPQLIGIELDANGWVDIEELIQKMTAKGRIIDRPTLELVVEKDNKKRYAIDFSQNKIRANQGHSVSIDLGYQPSTPPKILFHGTAKRFLNGIFLNGLQKKSRHHVHLSADLETATKVGQRHGKLVVLRINSLQMNDQGMDFFVTENGVWLTDHVPAEFLEVVTA